MAEMNSEKECSVLGSGADWFVGYALDDSYGLFHSGKGLFWLGDGRDEADWLPCDSERFKSEDPQ